MNHANKARGATEEGDMLRALQLMMTKVIKQDLKSADAQQDYQLEDFKMRKSQPRGDPLRRLLRSLVTKGMSAHVDATIQEDDEDPEMKALKEQLRTFQTRLEAFQDKMRSAPKEGNLMGHESKPWGGVEANERESVKLVTGTGVTLTEGLAALFPEADTPTGD